MLVLHLLAGNWLAALEDRAGDWVWAATAERTEERRLIVVDIDERSLAELGPWPWPRATQARLINQLAQAGARQQVLDIVFTNERPDDAILGRAIAHVPGAAAARRLWQQPGRAATTTTCQARGNSTLRRRPEAIDRPGRATDPRARPQGRGRHAQRAERPCREMTETRPTASSATD